MKNKRTTRVIASALAIASMIAMNPVGVSAAWRKDNNGWWYTEGNSWATGWRLIDGNWFYFYSDGYMAHDTTIDGYYLNSNGAWSNISVDCKNKETLKLSGTLRKSTWRHMNSAFYPDPIPYYYLELDSPTTFNNLYDENVGEYSTFSNITEIEIASQSPDYIKNRVNQHIDITGTLIVSPPTQYYQRQLYFKDCN